jgi:hypothetical protein
VAGGDQSYRPRRDARQRYGQFRSLDHVLTIKIVNDYLLTFDIQVARETPVWQSWLQECFPIPTELSNSQ